MNIQKEVSDLTINLKEQDILDRFYDRLRWPKKYPWGQPSIEVIKEDQEPHQDFFYEDGYLDVDKCIQYYKDGYSLVISRIGWFTKETTKIQNLLSKFYNQNINCNFYFGTGKKTISFPPHSHSYKVLVKNIYGSSTWMINDKKVKLTKQKVLFFDKDTTHQVIDIHHKKLSMTCNIQ